MGHRIHPSSAAGAPARATTAVRSIAVAALGAAALLVAVHAPTSARAATSHAPSAISFKSSSGHAASSGGPLIDHGGKVLSTSHTYAIFWGNQSAWASDVQSGIGSLFTGFNGSSFLNTGTQYMRGTSISSAYGGFKVDTSSPPSRSPSTSTIANEVKKVYGTSLDPQGIYFVFTSNFPRNVGFCAWHSYGSIGGQSIAVAYMPNTSGIAGCDPGNLYGVSGSQGLRSLANVTSHEFMEAITDTLPSSSTYGWIDSSGSEIGDKCAWTFGGPVTLSNGTTWQLQQEWSNAAGGCVQTT